MKGFLRGRLNIATMCSNWWEIADTYGVGIETDAFCQAENMEGARGDNAKADLAELMKTHDVRVLHGPFNELHPAAIDPRARALAMDRMNQAAEIALQAGIRKMVVHSGYVPFVYFKEWHHDRSVEFWREFMKDKPDDFEICIENVLDDEPHMLADIARDIDDSRVGLCLDVGHGNVVRNINGAGSIDPEAGGGGTDIAEWLEVTSPYIKHLHVHNNDGTGDFHNDITKGNIDMEALFRDIEEKCSCDTTVTLEVINCENSLDWLIEKGYY